MVIPLLANQDLMPALHSGEYQQIEGLDGVVMSLVSFA